MELVSQGMDPDALMAYFTENMLGWILYFCFMCFIFCVVVAGENVSGPLF